MNDPDLRLQQALQLVHDELDVRHLDIPPRDVSRISLDTTERPGPRHRLVVWTVAASLLMVSLAAGGVLLARTRSSQTVTAGRQAEVTTTVGAACESLPADYDPSQGVTLPVTVGSLPPGWQVLPQDASVGTYSVGQVGAAVPVAQSPSPLPLVSLFAVASEGDFINDLREAASLQSVELTTPRGTPVTVWTTDGAEMPAPLAIARWRVDNGPWIEATALHRVTSDQLLSVIDSTGTAEYCGPGR